MKIYLDNNILVSIENGDYTFDSIKSIIPTVSPIFVYSSAHLFEIENFAGNSFISKDELLQKRFKTIDEIFNGNYLYVDLKDRVVIRTVEYAQNVYETITQVPFGITAIKGFANLVTKEQKEQARQQLGVDILKLNNYSPKEVIKHLNTKLTNWQMSLSFLELIEYALQLHPDNKNFGLDNRVAGIFELLDMLGYWKDKETSTSNYARAWDASHSFFASHCDFFISDDKKTRNKAAVVYDIYRIQTQIMSSKGGK